MNLMMPYMHKHLTTTYHFCNQDKQLVYAPFITFMEQTQMYSAK